MSVVAGNAAPGEPADGRRRRTVRSRQRIIAAMLELIREGNVVVGAEAVAERAAVGLRTVFRHFSDMDSLYGEITVLIEAEVRAAFERPLDGTTWREQVAGLIDRRAEMFETIAPYKRAAAVHRPRSPSLEAAAKRTNAALRAVMIGVLPSGVAADRGLVEALDLLLSFEAWERLRCDQGLGRHDANQILRQTVARLLAGET